MGHVGQHTNEDTATARYLDFFAMYLSSVYLYLCVCVVCCEAKGYQLSGCVSSSGGQVRAAGLLPVAAD